MKGISGMAKTNDKTGPGAKPEQAAPAPQEATAPPPAPGLQDFAVTARPEQAAPRIAQLRREMADDGFDGFLVPRADAHQGEYVAPRDERLAWLTGFTGSAGMALVLIDRAAVFTDGRYKLQVRDQVDGSLFDFLDIPRDKPADYLEKHLFEGDIVGFDPWLHTAAEIAGLRRVLDPKGIELAETVNLIDRIWADQPGPPAGAIASWPSQFAGTTHGEKRATLAYELAEAGQKAAVLTLPDSIAWLLNIRGSDVPRMPVPQAFAILFDTGRVELFCDPGKTAPVADHLGTEVKVYPMDNFPAALQQLEGPVRIDTASAPEEVRRRLADAAVEIATGDDPCRLPKAQKTPAEIAATTEAHLRDGAAMCRFLHWLDDRIETLGKGDPLTEIAAVKALEGFRHDTGALKDLSFETIAGAGPHGAIVHYRVTEATDRAVRRGELLLIDSGGQYEDGTTDITRTIAVGQPSAEQRRCFTRVLKGMIAISRTRFPRGLAGRDLDALARAALWRHGQDYDHGTGHGVGVYLGVHEGPQRLSRTSEVALAPGMILSNEPGYYRAGEFGIRIENLIVVCEPAPTKDGDAGRDMLGFRTLTFAPIDRRLVNAALLSDGERQWLDEYHAEVARKIGPRLEGPAKDWLDHATRPI